ncbi:PH domain-containing protein [Streptomyces salinarius]|uniref:PH domain-containing protein n=1 Tax=Streptomyces salinarius TaxID=2762598 RepID=UPI0013D91F53|nr:PH domain-containing protein [Streptomyces salinarius]
MTAVDLARQEDHRGGPARPDVPWQRLHPRLIWVNAGRFLLSLVPTYVSMRYFGDGQNVLDHWFALVTTSIGVFLSISDVVRWLRTRYRITDELVEIRTGRIMRVNRQIPRERIRTVDCKARLRHRLTGLRVVFVSSGGARRSVKLDAVTKSTAEAIQHELMRGVEQEREEGAEETVLAEFRWVWLWYNVLNIWGVLVGGLLLWSLQHMGGLVGLDLIAFLDRVIDAVAPGPAVARALWFGVVALLGVCVLVSGFITGNWHFQLVRRATAEGTMLLTRHGMFSTREVHRDDKRLRGVHLSEPLFWRWMGLTETTVLSTGLATFSLSGEPASNILPRGPIGEARRVAALVLPDGENPLEAPLRRHPRAALYRRLWWAVAVPGALSGLLGWLGATRAVPDWTWLVPLWATPLTMLLAVVAHRSLGHTMGGRYLVLRCGLSRRRTTALQREAVLGLKLRQSVVQRWLGLVSMGVPTAAGDRYYKAPDMGTDQFTAFVGEAASEVVHEFLVTSRVVN